MREFRQQGHPGGPREALEAVWKLSCKAAHAACFNFPVKSTRRHAWCRNPSPKLLPTGAFYAPCGEVARATGFVGASLYNKGDLLRHEELESFYSDPGTMCLAALEAKNKHKHI